jgi:ABC-type transport system involved in multi-copper enzyme maturation permease subunit
MSSLPSTSQQLLPVSQRSANVVLGSQNFVSVLLRATAGELYKIRRRIMAKILLLIGVVIVVLAFSLIAIAVLTTSNANLHCTSSNNGQGQTCVRASNGQSANLTAVIAAPLHLPTSLTTTVGLIDSLGLVLIVVLAGAIVGGEYGVGTIRVLLTRGPTRTQYLLAKMLALLVCIAITVVILLPVGIIVGALYNLGTGIGVDFSFFTGDWVLHAVVYILLAVLNLFIYALIALWVATMGKSTAAGIAGGVLWWFLEALLGPILTAIGNSSQSGFGNFLKAVPDYFVGNNIGALLTEQSHYVTASAGSSSTIPDWRAWLVIAAYLVVILGITWLVSRSRDITG